MHLLVYTRSLLRHTTALLLRVRVYQLIQMELSVLRHIGCVKWYVRGLIKNGEYCCSFIKFVLTKAPRYNNKDWPVDVDKCISPIRILGKFKTLSTGFEKYARALWIEFNSITCLGYSVSQNVRISLLLHVTTAIIGPSGAYYCKL